MFDFFGGEGCWEEERPSSLIRGLCLIGISISYFLGWEENANAIPEKKFEQRRLK